MRSIKDVRSRVGLSNVKCGQGKAVSALFGAKTGFFEIYGVFVRTREVGGLSQCGHFRTREVNFSRFCVDIFYGRLLTCNMVYISPRPHPSEGVGQYHHRGVKSEFLIILPSLT